jgi:16S rRNA (adenine1518-N6/adenine1519-N6)-dimethyltransferase
MRAASSRDRRPGTRPRKRFGQHFLERAWVDRVVADIAPGDGEIFLEIGPGRGALTQPLAKAAQRVVAFEIDRDLTAVLRERAPQNLIVVEGDFLDLTPDRLWRVLEEAGVPSRVPLRVAGNLPYNVASPILFRLARFYRAGINLVDATVMIQREVADRLLAPPGTKDYGALSILIGIGADVERRFGLPPGAFRPPPKVDSAVVRLRYRPDDPAPASRETFEAVVRTVFTRRRKTLANALLALEADRDLVARALASSGLDGSRRPETLAISEFVRLADAFSAMAPGSFLPRS